MASEASRERVQTTCLLILTFIVSGVALHLVQSVLVPFVLAIFFVILLKPLIDWQVRHLRLPAGLSFATALLLGAGVLILLGALIAGSAADLAENDEEYTARFGEIKTRLSGFLESLGLDAEDTLERFLERLSVVARDTIGIVLDGLISSLSQGILILIFMGFLLPAVGAGPATGLWWEVEEGVRSFLRVKIAMNTLAAVLVYVVLVLCNVPLAPVFALLTFLLNFIPSVGSIIAVLLPIPVILLSPEVSSPWLAVVLPLPIQFVLGSVVEPKLMGRSIGLHPVTILLGLMFWGLLWGFFGMLMSVPLTLTARILFEQSEFTAPLARAMAGRFGAGEEPAAA